MQYFNHDTTASTDRAIMALRVSCGGAAVDAYWYLVEQMYLDETELVIFGNQAGSDAIAHVLCTESETLLSWVEKMVSLGLLERCGDGGASVTSSRMAENVSEFHRKSETARQNGKMGGRKPKAKPSGNQGGSKPETKSVSDKKPTAKPIKENKRVGFDKQNQTLGVPPVADAADAAPDETRWSSCPRCECGGTFEVGKDGGFALVCRECGKPYEPPRSADPEPEAPPGPAYLPIVPPPEIYPVEVPF